MPFTAFYLTPREELRSGLSEAEVRDAFSSQQGLLWVDVAHVTEEDSQFLQRTFAFHHLSIEDCADPRIHPPKIDDFGDYLFIVVHGINHAAETEVIETMELCLFLGRHFVVSDHNFPLYSVEYVRRLVQEDARLMRRGADFLAHALMDAVIDNFLPAIDNLTQIAEELEEEVIRNPRQTTLEDVLKVQRSALRLYHILASQRELLNRLSRGEFRLISLEAQIFYRDVYDNLTSIENLNQALRDMSGTALTLYLSSLANRQNEAMKTLAVVAAIFLPLTLVAGIYGMNFENMPELKRPWGYFAVLGFMATVIIMALAWFWARRWFTWGHRQVVQARRFAVAPEKLLGYLARPRGKTPAP